MSDTPTFTPELIALKRASDLARAAFHAYPPAKEDASTEQKIVHDVGYITLRDECVRRSNAYDAALKVAMGAA